jgi:hypothetical protein
MCRGTWGCSRCPHPWGLWWAGLSWPTGQLWGETFQAWGCYPGDPSNQRWSRTQTSKGTQDGQAHSIKHPAREFELTLGLVGGGGRTATFGPLALGESSHGHIVLHRGALLQLVPNGYAWLGHVASRSFSKWSMGCRPWHLKSLWRPTLKQGWLVLTRIITEYHYRSNNT